MKFMNSYDIENRLIQYNLHPVLGPATRTLNNLHEAANTHSDGWAFWPKPARAAAKLMELIEDGDRFDDEREDATPTKLRAAYSPIKAFRTKTGIQFEIEEL